MEEFKILQVGNRLIILLTCKHMLAFMKKKGWLQGQSLQPRGQSCKTEDYSQALKPNVVCPAGFQSHLKLMTPFFLSFSPLLNWNVCICYPMPVPPLYLENNNLLLELSSQLPRWRWIVPQDELYPKPYPDLMRFGTFELMKFRWDFGHWVDAVMDWDFWRWDEMNVFYMWMEVKIWGAEVDCGW